MEAQVVSACEREGLGARRQLRKKAQGSRIKGTARRSGFVGLRPVRRMRIRRLGSWSWQCPVLRRLGDAEGKRDWDTKVRVRCNGENNVLGPPPELLVGMRSPAVCSAARLKLMSSVGASGSLAGVLVIRSGAER